MPEEDLFAARLREKMMQAMVEAALGGHDLGRWEPASRRSTRRFRATCRKCSKWVDVGAVTIYGVLEDSCPGSPDD